MLPGDMMLKELVYYVAPEYEEERQAFKVSSKLFGFFMEDTKGSEKAKLEAITSLDPQVKNPNNMGDQAKFNFNPNAYLHHLPGLPVRNRLVPGGGHAPND
jgi:hypothetical protein